MSNVSGTRTGGDAVVDDMGSAIPPAREPGAAGQDIAAAAQLACLLEAHAPKPGNISPGRHFDDTRYEDFLASAAAIGGPLAGAAARPLGTTIRQSVEATARWAGSNTNLGIVLLLGPLVVAACRTRTAAAREGLPAHGGADALRAALREVLQSTTIDDAREVYAAIRLAAPGGLGRVAAEDVAGEPTKPPLEVMRLAAERDAIAREYATAFAVTFGTGAPALARARRDGLSWDDAVVETFLTLLSETLDTHVARRGGEAAAADVSRRAARALACGGVRTPAGRREIEDMDRALRDERHLRNPGAAADLTAAAVFVVLVAIGWHPDRGGSDAAAR
jgi:triphosphoribosyl-dephospho-CoA synthase